MSDPSVPAAAGGSPAAAGAALARCGPPLLHLHLTDRTTGLGQLLEAMP
jgi:hypothetical protein